MQNKFKVLRALTLFCAGLLWTSSIEVCGHEKSLCPDLPKSEQLLNEGQKYTGGRPYGARLQLPEVIREVRFIGPFIDNPKNQTQKPKSRSGFYRRVNQFTQVRSDYYPCVLQVHQIDNLPLTTTNQIDSAEVSARAYEAATEYNAAKQLYQRILSARVNAFPVNKVAIDSTIEDIARVGLCQSAQVYEDKKEYAKAVSLYGQVLQAITSQRKIDLATRISLIAPIVSKLESFQAHHIEEAKAIRLQAQHLHDSYKRTLACIDMAGRLDHCALKLECDGMYTMAEKSYKQSLEIKENNLGKHDPDTLSVYGDLARLCAEQGRYSEAQNIYEQALAVYRKLPNPGNSYTSMLENYGDMLNHINQTSKADQIYSEAKAFHTKFSASSEH